VPGWASIRVHDERQEETKRAEGVTAGAGSFRNRWGGGWDVYQILKKKLWGHSGGDSSIECCYEARTSSLWKNG